MLFRRVVHRSLLAPRPPRCPAPLHTSSVLAAKPGKDPRLSQGTASQPSSNQHPQDPHSQAARSGQSNQDMTPHDAASSQAGKQAPHRDLSGNPEGVGFAEQVGSQSATMRSNGAQQHEGKAGEEESTPPGVVGAIKSKLGLGTSTGETKQNRGGGAGVTGTGTMPGSNVKRGGEGRRALHTSAVRLADPTRGQAPQKSRQPRDRPHGEQNPHLKHKSADGTAVARDQGKGNAGESPSLPSRERLGKAKGDLNPSQPRAFSTSASHAAEKHTAESYFKDVDDRPPASSKTHQVDGSVTGAQVQRSDEPQTGDFSQAGSQTPEYELVDKDRPYDLPPSSGPDSEKKLRYGNTNRLQASESGNGGGDSVSKPNEGPEGTNKGGRKPEGR